MYRESAIKLTKKFTEIIEHEKEYTAKKCALITVNEILELAEIWGSAELIAHYENIRDELTLKKI